MATASRTRRHASAMTTTAITTALVLTGCTIGDPSPPPPSGAATGSTAPRASPSPPGEHAPRAVAPAGGPIDVTTGLDAPWSIVFIGDTALIGERDSGRVREVLPDGSTREAGVVDGVSHGGEGGLLGLAVDTDDRLYAYSTSEDGNRVRRHELRGSPGSFSLGPAETIVDGLPAARTHNGGRIAFGPDGMLYVAVGDASRPAEAQDLGSLAGKILRMTPDGQVPGDNPFTGSPVYSYGHRNVQGMGWAADGTMFASEFGQNTWDELNVIVPGGNYGWPDAEGAAGREGFIDPVQQWEPADASPSGLAVVAGTVFIANLRGQVLRAVPVSEPAVAEDHYAGEYGRLRDVAPAPDGSLWLLTNNTDGRGEPRDGDDRVLSVELAG